MKSLKVIFIFLPLLIIFNSCEQDEAIDTQKPKIDLTIEEAFPVNCDTIYFGEAFDLKVLFQDNVQLGSYSIDIHHNFDHHSHSTEVTECDLAPIKPPVNPFVFIENYAIPAGMNEMKTLHSISIPSGSNGSLYDEGDYHFFISLTDKEGWSIQKGLSIKMLHR